MFVKNNLFLRAQLLSGVIILRTVCAVRNAEYGYHEQHGKTDNPFVVLPFQSSNGCNKEYEG